MLDVGSRDLPNDLPPSDAVELYERDGRTPGLAKLVGRCRLEPHVPARREKIKNERKSRCKLYGKCPSRFCVLNVCQKLGKAVLRVVQRKVLFLKCRESREHVHDRILDCDREHISRIQCVRTTVSHTLYMYTCYMEMGVLPDYSTTYQGGTT